MLYFLLIEGKKKKKERKTAKGPYFSLGQTRPIGCAVPGFFWMLGAFKSCFKGQSLNLMCT
jgi:hypothetical protein